MITIEDRLRDAYRAAAETVRPDTIRQLGERAVTITRHRSRRSQRATSRMIIPLAAATAVALVAIALAVIIPQLLPGLRSDIGPGHRGSASPAGRFVVAVTGISGKSAKFVNGGQALSVHNATTGASVATIAAPKRGMYFSGLATGDGRHYIAELWRTGRCRTWLYEFRLNAAGHPSRLAPFALPAVAQRLNLIAVSADNTTFAYSGATCVGNRTDLATVSLGSMRTTRWTMPGREAVGSLSLTADGSVLAYSTDLTKFMKSAAYVLPTSAHAGTAVERSKLVAAASRFGASDEINSAVITPDASTMYCTTNRTGRGYDNRWQLRAADVSTDRLRVVGRYAGLPVFLTADPSVGRILEDIEFPPHTAPSPAPSPTRSPAPSNTASPAPSPTGSPMPSVSGSPVPSPSRSPVPSQTASPVLSATGSPVPSPSPTSSGGQPSARMRVALIDLGTGSLTFPQWPGWPDQNVIFTW